MKRKIYKNLCDWKHKNNRKPLIILGARQVGKTWIMKEFGMNEYRNVVYVNCDDEPRTKDLFTDDYDIERIILGLQAITGEKISPADTLIIIDEIQEAPRGLHCLKYFCEKAPEYHVMTAGSLLGVTLGQKESFPVGKVDLLHMYPMDYEEFLEAIGEENLCATLRTADWGLIELMNTRFINCLRQYYFAGGMPEAVKCFADNKDLKIVREIQSDILTAYRNDISKHVDKRESVRIGQVLNSLPSQLIKENKKFIYGILKHGARATEYEIAIQWLIDAGLVYKVNRIRSPKMPLKFYEDPGAFKLFMVDVGLFNCMADIPASSLLVGNDGLVEFKGALTEEYVAQQLISSGCTPYYWSNENNTSEIDFIIQHNEEIIPIEVKAEVNVRAKSFAMFLKANAGLKGLRFSMLPYVRQDNMENVPLFAIQSYLNCRQ